MTKQTEREFLRNMAQKEFSDHVIRETPSVSRKFSRREGGSFYWFSMTWVPGIIHLAGDVGEISIIHYQALANFRKGMEWLIDAEFEYLMSKASPREMVSDAENTFDVIVSWANEAAIESFQERRKSLKWFYTKAKDSREEWRAEHDAWRIAGSGVEPVVGNYLPDKKEHVDELFVEVKQGSLARFCEAELQKIDKSSNGFRIWLALWNTLSDEIGIPADPNCIFKARGREAIKETLRSVLRGMSEAEIAKFCQEIGIDDYYGSKKYPSSAIWKIEAIKKGATLMLAEEKKKEWVLIHGVIKRVMRLREILSVRRKFQKIA